MKITLLSIGKTTQSWLQEGIMLYQNRLQHYTSFEYTEIDDVKLKSKKPDAQKVMKAEAEKILKHLQPTDHLILLDENGKHMSSEVFSQWMEKKQVSGIKNLVFLIGGPYGFDDSVKSRAVGKVSLSAMTFSHQMVRLFAIEQIYRAHTILKGEPYHHR